jgi:hypothetical protein
MMTSGKAHSLFSILLLFFMFVWGKGNGQPNEVQVENYIRVKLLNASNFSDETILRFLPGSTKGFDPASDAYKLFGAQLNVFIKPDSNLNLAINAVPFPSPGDSIDLGFNANYGDYRFVITGLNSFTNNMVLVLSDKLTNGQRILQENDTIPFSVILNPLSYGYRFKIKYFFPTAVQNLERGTQILNFSSKSGWHLPDEIRAYQKRISWYSIEGQRLKSDQSLNEVIPIFPSGIYLIRTEEENPKTIKALIQN